MLKLLLCCCFPAFAALPAILGADGRSAIPNSSAEAKELLGRFSIGGDGETPFILQIVFENCRELKDEYGNALRLTLIELKYQKTNGDWITKEDLSRVPIKGQNCPINIIFYENEIQNMYHMELWASWDRQNANAGTFFGRAYLNILPRY